MGLEIREYGRRDPSRWPQTLALISPTSGGRSVGIVRSRTQATEFFIINYMLWNFVNETWSPRTTSYFSLIL
jgi:hypothetical protein